MSTLVDTMDYNYHDSWRQIFQLYHDAASLTGRGSCTWALISRPSLDDNFKERSAAINEGAQQVQAAADKGKFFQEHSFVFKVPREFEMLKHETDQVSTIQYNPDTLPEMIARYQELETKVLFPFLSIIF